MGILDYIDQINNDMAVRVESMKMVADLNSIGLDVRSASRLWVDEDCIIVRLGNDRSLQYYGGFEYVEKSCRYELGNYVVYTAEDDRVRDHIEQYYSYLNDRAQEQLKDE